MSKNLYTVKSGYRLLGVAEATLARWLKDHKVEPDFILVRNSDKPFELYTLETLQAVKELREKDNKRKGRVHGNPPAGFSYAEFKVTREQVGGYE